MIDAQSKPFAVQTREEAMGKLNGMVARGDIATQLRYWADVGTKTLGEATCYGDHRALVAAACAEFLCLTSDAEGRILSRDVFQVKIDDALKVMEDALLSAWDNSPSP